MSFGGAELMAELLFGLIGMAAFMYAKKQSQWKTALIAVLLLGYPYFVSGTLLLYGVGVVLTCGLFMFRD